METVNHRLQTENTLLRRLLLHAITLTPERSPASAFLERARPAFDPTAHADVAPIEEPGEPEDPDPIDPITEALREHPTARELQGQRMALAATLQRHLPKPHWPLFLDYEALTESHAQLREELAFAHAFRLGQTWPLLDPPISPEPRRALTALARAAAKRNTPPLQRLRILLRAALLSLEDATDVAPHGSAPTAG